MTWLATLEMTGRSLTGATVKTNVFVAESPSPSVTVAVKVVLPNWLVAGRMVTSRLLPEPPRKILLSGKRLWSNECRESCKLMAGVSKSPMVIGMFLAVSSSVVWPAIGAITGGILTISDAGELRAVPTRLETRTS